nr:MFS transporter [Ardenticatena sp.]
MQPNPMAYHPPHAKIEVASRALPTIVLGSLFLRMASMATGVTLSLFLAYLHREHFPVRATLVGFITASFYISELVGSPFAGALSDRFSRRAFMAWGGLLGGIAVLLTLGVLTIPTALVAIAILIFTRLLEGLSTAVSVPATLSYLSSMTSGNMVLRGRAMAAYEVGTLGGFALGSLAGGVLWDRLGIAAFLVIAALYALSTLVFWFGVPPLPKDKAPETSIMRKLRLMTQPAVLRLAPAWLAVNAIIGLWFSHATYQMGGDIRFEGQSLMGGFSGTTIGTIFFGYLLTFALGIYVWGHVLARVGVRRTLHIGIVGMLQVTLVIFAINHTPLHARALVWGWLFLLGIGLLLESGLTPAGLAYLADISEGYSQDRGAIMGVYSVLLGLGQLLGGWLGGPFAEWRGIDGMVVLTILLIGVAAMTIWRLPEHPHAQPKPS